MAERHVGEVVRRLAQELSDGDLDSLWGRVRQEPVDESALRDLVNLWAPGLLGYCCAVLNDEHAAEDVVSESFAALVRRRTGPASAAAALRYLWTTVARSARRVRWRAARRRRHEAPGDVAAALDPRHPDPAAGAVSAEVGADITAALRRLSENERCAVVLVSFLGHTEEEAAAVMGCSRSSVSTYLARAREKLSRLLVRWKGVVGAAAGAGVAEDVLTGAARAGNLHAPSAEVLDRILRHAATPAGSLAGWVKTATVLLAAGAACGVAAAVWTAPAPLPPNPSAGARAPADPDPAESVPDRNLRVFRSEVLPRQREALRPLALGGGEVVLRSVEAYDVRITCVYELRHKAPGLPGWSSALRLGHNTHDRLEPKRHTGLDFDPCNRGDWKPIDPKRPVVLWRNPLTGAETVWKSRPLEAAVSAFDRLPIDDRTAAEFWQFAARMDAAAAPLLGPWYVRADPDRRCEVRLERGNLQFLDGHPAPGVYLYSLRLGPDGRLRGLNHRNATMRLAADGRRIDFLGTDEWWSREPRAPQE